MKHRPYELKAVLRRHRIELALAATLTALAFVALFVAGFSVI